MGFFSRKKQRKRDAQQRGASESEARTDVEAKRVPTPSSDAGSASARELAGSHRERSAPTPETGHARRSSSGTLSPKHVEKRRAAPTPPPTPPPILHKTTQFGMEGPTSPPPICHTSPVPAYHVDGSARARVRFAAPSGGSVASQSEASNVHMMAGSVASSSAMSSVVLSEEDRRLAAMGMGRAGPPGGDRYAEDHDRSRAVGIDPKSARLNAMGMSRGHE